MKLTTALFALATAVGIACACQPLFAQDEAAEVPKGCTSEVFERQNVSGSSVDTYTAERQSGQTRFTVSGSLSKSELPDRQEVTVCAGYARLEANGRAYLIRQAAYHQVCSCNAQQQRDAGVPGVGNIRRCETCPDD